MRLTRSESWTLSIPLAHLAAATYLYSIYPERIASHWNAAGEVDGYMGKFWGLFLMPAIALSMWLLFLAVPRIDPKRENIQKFRAAFDDFIAAMFTFFTYLYCFTLFWNAGYHISLNRAMPFAFAFLTFSIARLLAATEPNWSIGIRTPWTLSSASVWKQTHLLAAKLFTWAGVIAMLGMFWPKQAIYLAIVPLVLAALYSVVYSYLLYRREMGVGTPPTTN